MQVLSKVKLESFVRSDSRKLMMHVSAGGKNCSVGQRQLFCLARALLGQAKGTMLDMVEQ